MFSKVISSAVLGVDGTRISVEADVNDGLPMFTMVGYLSSSVKEAGERVRTALKNSGYHMPPKRITINLSPADIRKEGSGFDLPIALAVLLALGITSQIDMDKTVVIGELGLDGNLKPVTGVLPRVYHCIKNGITNCIVPEENVKEAALAPGMKVYGFHTLKEVVEFIQGSNRIPPVINDMADFTATETEDGLDFADVKGQVTLKRGMEIGAAGFHNILMTGAAGAGKSMLAKRLPTIMPRLTFEECIDITKIYSIRGLLDNNNVLITKRPFRAPHHTISNHGLVGGGVAPAPGEITLAHNGVLFLDELPEFSKNALEVLRQPLEDRYISISRVNSSYIFPADFMLVAAMNQCPCGNYPNLGKCTCTPNEIRRYQGRISGPLMDRIDITMEVKPIPYKELFVEGSEEKSQVIRERVESARERQQHRYKDENILFNSQLEGSLIKKYITLGHDEENMFKDIFRQMELSARGIHRIIKLARTIADLEGADHIRTGHIMEATFFRNSGKMYDKEMGI